MFVRGAITGVAVEGVIAALLTSVMILLFLGSWRSTIIIAISIPLSVLGAIVMLSAIGETLNIMTLGGLALAVGILVDDATVTIENINWHLEQGKDVETSILDGANPVSYTHLPAHETVLDPLCPLLLEKKKNTYTYYTVFDVIDFLHPLTFTCQRYLYQHH